MTEPSEPAPDQAENAPPETGLPIAIEALDLAALLASRLCHDVVGPVGAIINGIELIEEDDSEETRAMAFDLIRKSAAQASSRLQFARIAFGSAGVSGTAIDLGYARELSEAFFDDEKITLLWEAPRVLVEKTRAKLLMNLILVAQAAIPIGGTIRIAMTGEAENPGFCVEAEGLKARIPPDVPVLLSGRSESGEIDSRGVQIYLTGALARAAGLALTQSRDGERVRFLATPEEADKNAP